MIICILNTNPTLPDIFIVTADISFLLTTPLKSGVGLGSFLAVFNRLFGIEDLINVEEALLTLFLPRLLGKVFTLALFMVSRLIFTHFDQLIKKEP